MKTIPAFFLTLISLATTGLAVLAEPPVPLDPSTFTEPIRVACVGDSITQGYGSDNPYPSQLQGILGDKWQVKNFGVSGRTLLKKGDAPYWNEQTFKDAKDFKPNVVIIMLGTNDTKAQNWVHKKDFDGDYKDLVKEFKDLDSKPLVYVCLPCPVFDPGAFGITSAILKLETPLIERLARTEDLGLIDMHTPLEKKPELLPDTVHPNGAGDTVLAQTAAAALTGKPAN